MIFNRKLVIGVMAAGCVLAAGLGSDVHAATIGTSVGAAQVLGNSIQVEANTTQDIKKASAKKETAEKKEEKKVTSVIDGIENLGVASVENHLNIRESASEDAKLVGVLQNNAGCNIIETQGGWSKIKSGKVTGFVKSEYLVTGEEANKLAEQVMTTVAIVNTETLYVRKEPSKNVGIVSMVPIEEELEVKEDLGDWLHVELDEDDSGYISKDYVVLSHKLKTATTMSELKYGEGVSDVRVDIVQYACQFIGNPYVWGGTSLTNGADCSGFTMSVMAKYGVYLPHSSSAQAGCGTKVAAEDALPGDLFFYGDGRINHVAIYIGNGQVVHASSAKTGIKISNAFYRTPICVTRVLN